MSKKKMNKKENQNDGTIFLETVENKIEVAFAKSKEEKVVSEPKPKSGKGL